MECDDELVQVHVSRWLSERENAQWLLIFDNHSEPEQYDIIHDYPHTSQGSIIITTRSPDMVLDEEIRVLPMLDETEGLAILKRRDMNSRVGGELVSEKQSLLGEDFRWRLDVASAVPDYFALCSYRTCN